MELIVNLRQLHDKQWQIRNSPAKRKVIRAGRRSGKTTLAADIAVDKFLDGHRVLYGAPTEDQVGKFWFEVKQALAEPLDKKVFYKNETRHIIELAGTEQRIRAKTAWDADSLRGDYADYLILDEYQLMKPEAWGLVGAPMLLDNDGDALFIYTKRKGAKGRHASDLYKQAEADTTGRWYTESFSSHDNPHISETALADITQDMTNLAYRMEIMAEEVEDDPDALWTRETLEKYRVTSHPDLDRVVVGVDPPGSALGAECGIVAAGTARIDGVLHGYLIADDSKKGSPAEWGSQAVATYNRMRAGKIVAEKNFGGDMVGFTIESVDGGQEVAFELVWASRGKAIRAEPIAAYYEQGRVHHVGSFEELEDEQCTWVPGDKSPNRLDGAVWALTDLMVGKGAGTGQSVIIEPVDVIAEMDAGPF